MSQPAFIDVCVNVLDPQFQGTYMGKHKHERDLDLVLGRARAAGVVAILGLGGDLSECTALCASADQIDPSGRYMGIAVGVHPTRSEDFMLRPTEMLNHLRSLISSHRHRIAAIGEIGLDYDRTQFSSI
eukprot:Lankesteria_metandrocarpae@DN10111_c0_g1_i1.p1